jgi:hypothetical protein
MQYNIPSQADPHGMQAASDKRTFLYRSAILFISTFGICSSAMAFCPKWEYNKFKDASKSALIKEYCTSTKMAEIQGSLVEISRQQMAMGLKSRQDVTEAENAQIACLQQADEASEMLEKKFKIKGTITCPSKSK